MTAQTTPSHHAQRKGLTVTVVLVAAVMQLAVAVPFTAAVGLLAPLWGVAGAWSLWLASTAAFVFLARRHPMLTPVVPVVNAGLLFAFVTVGASLLGWAP